MATQQDFMDFVMEQATGKGLVSCRKMFGEYALYYEGKVVAFVCDDKVFIKPTEAGLKYIGEPNWAPPYPGAKPYLLVESLLEDRDAFSYLLQITASQLPEPKPKKPKSKPRRKTP